MKGTLGLEYAFSANLAGWDNEPRVVPREEAEMTFTYAVIADSGIVLCADSQLMHAHTDQFGNVIGTYEGRRGKIRRLGNGFAFSIAGNAGLVDTLLSEVDESQVEKLESFEQAVQVYQAAFRAFLDKKYGEQRLEVRQFGVAFLFCGFVIRHGKSLPQIVKLDITADFVWNPITGRDCAATGTERHGAAYYLHHRFYREGMPLEQAKLLAYCTAKEVADLDNSVGGPIEMEVITEEGSRALTDGEIRKYEKARQKLIGNVGSYLADFH